uniref:Uncharacterized protein n=1 Tax=Rhabditophanes sp. KR3021 TaxID=114890 RepID=A0AC35TXF2_9BILA
MNPKRVLEDASKKVVKIIDFQDKHRKSHINFANHKMEHILKMGRNHEETAKRSSEAVKASANEIGKYKKKAESSTATAENYREQFNELNKKYAELRTSISSTQRTVTRSSSPIKTIGSGVTKHSSKKNDFSSKSNQTQFTTSMLLGYSTAASQNQTNQQHGNPFRNTSNILSMGGNTNLNQLFDISAERTVLKAKGEPYLTSTPFGGHLYGKENQSKSFKDTPRPRNPFGNNHLY